MANFLCSDCGFEPPSGAGNAQIAEAGIQCGKAPAWVSKKADDSPANPQALPNG